MRPRTRRLAAPLGALVAVALTAGSASAAFPGQNGLIGFTSDAGGNKNLFSSADGLNWTQLTSDAGEDAQLAWSPDGNRIAFRSRRDGNYEVYVADANGDNQARLTTTPPPPTGTSPWSSMPSWSPDGTQITFRSNRDDGTADIYVMNADGSDQRKVVALSGDERYPGFSPDGSRIVFQSNADGDREIYVMRSNGTRVKQLTRNSVFDSAPAWSPDGASIAFERSPTSSGTDLEREIMLMADDGSNVRQLTSNDAHDEGPAFSPDGTKVAFTSERDGNSEIYVMSADGSGQSRFTAASTLEESPDWQPLPSSSGADITPPETTITSGPPKRTRSSTATFEFSASEPVSRFTCRLDGGSPHDCSSGITYEGIAVGEHTFSVYATDLAGNVDPTPATHTWTRR